MAKVLLPADLALHAAGVHEIELDVANVRQLFAALAERYPGLSSQLETEVAVAIDGELYQDALLQPIAGDSEVILLPKIEGG